MFRSDFQSVRGGTVIRDQPPSGDELWDVVQQFQEATKSVTVDMGWWKCSPKQCKPLGVLLTVATKDQIPPVRSLQLSDTPTETTVYQFRLSLPTDAQQFSTLVELHREVAISVFNEVLKEGDNYHFKVPLLSTNTINWNPVVWFRFGQVTTHNYAKITQHLSSIIDELNRLYPTPENEADEESIGRERWRYLRFYNLFENTIDNETLGQRLTFQLLTKTELIRDPSVDDLKNYGSINLLWPKQKGFSEIISRAENALLLVDESHEQLLYKMLVALNDQFGVAGERHIETIGDELRLSDVSRIHSGTYIAVTREKFKNPNLIIYPNNEALKREAWTPRAVINISVVKERAPLVVAANYKALPITFETPSVPQSHPAIKYVPFEWKAIDEVQLWKGQVVPKAENLNPSTHPNSEALYAFIEEPYKLDDNTVISLSSVPFEVRTTDGVVLLNEDLRRYLRSVSALQRLEITHTREIVRKLGEPFIIEVTNYVPENSSDPRWSHMKAHKVTDLPKSFKISVSEVDEDTIGMYDFSFKQPNGVPGLLRFFVDAVGTCVRCRVGFTESTNMHGSCQWHTQHGPKIEYTDELIRGLFSTQVPLNPNLYMGQYADPNNKLGRRWVCCNKTSQHVGCWIGRHSATSIVPDLQDYNHNAPKHGTQHINDQNTSPAAHAEIVSAYEEGRFDEGVDLERRFNSVHGGVLRPTFQLFTKDAEAAYERLLSEGRPYNSRDLEMVFMLLDYDASFGLWERNETLARNYKSSAPLLRSLPTEQYEQTSVELFTIFDSFKREMGSEFNRQVFRVWKAKAKTRGLIRDVELTEEEVAFLAFKARFRSLIEDNANSRRELLKTVQGLKEKIAKKADTLQENLVNSEKYLSSAEALPLFQIAAPVLVRYETLSRNFPRETVQDVITWERMALEQLLVAQTEEEASGVFRKFNRGLGSGIIERDRNVFLKPEHYWRNAKDQWTQLNDSINEVANDVRKQIEEAKKEAKEKEEELKMAKKSFEETFVELVENQTAPETMLKLAMPTLQPDERTVAEKLLETGGVSIEMYQNLIGDEEALLSIFRGAADTRRERALQWLRTKVADEIAKEVSELTLEQQENIYDDIIGDVRGVFAKWNEIDETATEQLTYDARYRLLTGVLAVDLDYFKFTPETENMRTVIAEAFNDADLFFKDLNKLGFTDYKDLVQGLIAGEHKPVVIPQNLALAALTGESKLYDEDWRVVANYLAALATTLKPASFTDRFLTFFTFGDNPLEPLFALVKIQDTLANTMQEMYKALPNPTASAVTNLAKIGSLHRHFNVMFNYFRETEVATDLFVNWMATLAVQTDVEVLLQNTEERKKWREFVAIAEDSEELIKTMTDEERPVFTRSLWEIWNTIFTKPMDISEKLAEFSSPDAPEAGQSQYNYIVRTLLREPSRIMVDEPLFADVFLYGAVGDSHLRLFKSSDYSGVVTLGTAVRNLYSPTAKDIGSFTENLTDADVQFLDGWFREFKSLLFRDIEFMHIHNILTTYRDIEKRYSSYSYVLYFAQTSPDSYLNSSIVPDVQNFRGKLLEYNEELQRDNKQFQTGTLEADRILEEWNNILENLIQTEDRFERVAASIRQRLPFILNKMFVVTGEGKFSTIRGVQSFPVAIEFADSEFLGSGLQSKWMYHVDLSEYLFGVSNLEENITRNQPDAKQPNPLPNEHLTMGDAYAMGKRLEHNPADLSKRAYTWNVLDPLDYLARTMILLILFNKPAVRENFTIDASWGPNIQSLYDEIQVQMFSKYTGDERTGLATLLIENAIATGDEDKLIDAFVFRHGTLVGRNALVFSDLELYLAQLLDKLDLDPYDSTTKRGTSIWGAIAELLLAWKNNEVDSPYAERDSLACMVGFLRCEKPYESKTRFLRRLLQEKDSPVAYARAIETVANLKTMVVLNLSQERSTPDELLFYYDLFVRENGAANQIERVKFAVDKLGLRYIPFTIDGKLYQAFRADEAEQSPLSREYLESDVTAWGLQTSDWRVVSGKKDDILSREALVGLLSSATKLTVFFEDTFGFAVIRSIYLVERNRHLERLLYYPEYSYEERLFAVREKRTPNIYDERLEFVNKLIVSPNNDFIDNRLEEIFLKPKQEELLDLYFEGIENVNFFELFRSNMRKAAVESFEAFFPRKAMIYVRDMLSDIVEASKVSSEDDVAGLTPTLLEQMTFVHSTIANKEYEKRTANILDFIFSSVESSASNALSTLRQLNETYRTSKATVLDERKQNEVINLLQQQMIAVQNAGFEPLSRDDLSAIFERISLASTAESVFKLERFYDDETAEKLYEVFRLLVVPPSVNRAEYENSVEEYVRSYATAKNPDEFFAQPKFTIQPPRPAESAGLAQGQYFQAAVYLSYWLTLERLEKVPQGKRDEYQERMRQTTTKALEDFDFVLDRLRDFYLVSGDLTSPAAVVYWTAFLKEMSTSFDIAKIYKDIEDILDPPYVRYATITALPVSYNQNPKNAPLSGRLRLATHQHWTQILDSNAEVLRVLWPVLQSQSHHQALVFNFENSMLKRLTADDAMKTRFDTMYELDLSTISRPWLIAPPREFKKFNDRFPALGEKLDELPTKLIEFKTDFGVTYQSHIDLKKITREKDFLYEVDGFPDAYPPLPTRILKYSAELRALETTDDNIKIITSRFREPSTVDFAATSKVCSIEREKQLYRSLSSNLEKEFTEDPERVGFLSTLYNEFVAKLTKPELQNELAYLDNALPTSYAEFSILELLDKVNTKYKQRLGEEPDLLTGGVQTRNRYNALKKQLETYNERTKKNEITIPDNVQDLSNVLLRIYVEPFLPYLSFNKEFVNNFLQKAAQELFEETTTKFDSITGPEETVDRPSYLYIAYDTAMEKVVGQAIWSHTTEKDLENDSLNFPQGTVQPESYKGRTINLRALCGSEKATLALLLRGLVDTATLDSVAMVKVEPKITPSLLQVQRTVGEVVFAAPGLYYPMDYDQTSLLLKAGFFSLVSSDYNVLTDTEVQKRDYGETKWYHKEAEEFFAVKNKRIANNPPHVSPSLNGEPEELSFKGISDNPKSLLVSPLLSTWTFEELKNILLARKIGTKLPFEMQVLLNTMHNRVMSMPK